MGFFIFGRKLDTMENETFPTGVIVSNIVILTTYILFIVNAKIVAKRVYSTTEFCAVCYCHAYVKLLYYEIMFRSLLSHRKDKV